MKQDQNYGKQRFDQMQGAMNNMQLDMREVRDKVIRLEAKTDKK